jgi:hypothetical protein
MTNTSLKMEINSLPKEHSDEVTLFVATLKKKAETRLKLSVREFGLGKSLNLGL